MAEDYISLASFLQHWLGHRQLTKRTLEAFPEDRLFTFSLGGMRSFGEQFSELLGMALPSVEGIATGDWSTFKPVTARDKDTMLAIWSSQSDELARRVPLLTLESLHAQHVAFGQWPMSGVDLLRYVVDNEIHHRAQGFVYLRALGIDPPPFWERG